MNGQRDLDVRLERWFGAEAPMRAPDRVLVVAMDRVGRTGQRRSRGPWRAVRVIWRDLTPSRRALLVAIGLLALLVAGVVAASMRTATRTPADLIVVRRLVADQPDSGFEALAVSPDGRERSLGQWAGGALEAPWDGNSALVASSGLLAVGLSGAPDGSVAVVDLRSDAVSPRYPDVTGYLGSWDAEGVRMARDEDDGITVYDLRTSAVTRVRMPTGASMPGQEPMWAADGSGLIVVDGTIKADEGVAGLVRPAAPSVLRLDGSSSPGPIPAAEDGVGQRRLRADGALLECGMPSAMPSKGMCIGDGNKLWSVGRRYEAVWTDGDPLTRIADFAWAADGELWLVTETVASGPREVQLIHVEPMGATRSVLTLGAGADDPDPNGHCPAGSIGAMAPDDSRLVITTTGDGCSTGSTFVVDTTSGATTQSAGVVAGWLPAGGLDRPRPGLASVADAPGPVRGDWGRIADHQGVATSAAAVRLRLGRSTAELRWGTGESMAMSLAPSGDHRLVLTAFAVGLGCPVGTAGTYAWAVADDGLELRAVDDPCPQRAALLASTFAPTLELAGNWEPRAVAGRTYLVPEIGLRFTVATDQDTWIWSRSEKAVELGSDHDGWLSLSWPTDPPAADLRGLDAGVAFIDSLAASGIQVVDRTTTTVDGRPAITGRIERTGDPGLGAEIWPAHAGGPGFNVLDGTQLTLLTDPAGRLYTIVVRGADDPTVAAWAKALIDSLRWEGE